MPRAALTGVERFFDNEQIIVSKTDLKGRITYANQTFVDMAGMDTDRLIGAPHSVIRHPHMPRAVFRLLWDTISRGEEVFAYVLNQCANGDHYWVFAHVTPTFSDGGEVIGYHSNRRVPDREAVDAITALYADMLAAETEAGGDGRGSTDAGTERLMRALDGTPYSEYIFELAPSTRQPSLW